MVIILDACALIAYLNGEEGCHVIEDLLLSSEETYIHAANWCEVCYDFLKRDSGDSKLQELRDALPELGIKIYRDMGDPLLMLVASLKTALYGKKKTISFADCFALASTKLLRASLVTSDYEMGNFTDFCNIHFFRKPKKLWFQPHPLTKAAMEGAVLGFREQDLTYDEKVRAIRQIIGDAEKLLKTGILDKTRFREARDLTLGDACEHEDESGLHFFEMGECLEEIYNAPAMLRAILVGVLAGSGHGPPLSE